MFSKGHASPLPYTLSKAAGVISDAQLMSLRQFGNPLEGHPIPVLPWVDVATGSLVQGLPIGIGIGWGEEYLDKLPYRIWVLLGDSEMAEGSVWEAFELTGNYKLESLIAIVDVNWLGQRGQTMWGWNTQAYCDCAEAFGWNVIEINGHNFTEIDEAYNQAISDSVCLRQLLRERSKVRE